MTTAAADSLTDQLPTDHSPTARSPFAALRVPDFRIYLICQSIANTGTWMHSIAQHWLVLELTGSGMAVGLTLALQFAPILLLGMHGGMVADRYPKRTILLTTHATSAVLAAALAVLTLTGEVQTGHVYLLALAGGLVFVIDNPTKQVFVTDLVPARHQRGAVALTAAVFHATRLLGPAVAAVLIGTVGVGWAFAANAVCYLGPLTALALMRTAGRPPGAVTVSATAQLRSALRHVAARPPVVWTIGLVAVVGLVGHNLPVILTAMASTTFAGDAGLYGLFNVVLAGGSVAGALIAASRPHSRLRLLILLAAAFGVTQTAAALAPGRAFFLVALAALRVANLAFLALTNSAVQMWVDPAMRGRVMGLYVLAFTGGTPLGAPVIGWLTVHVGPRTAMAVCGIVPLLAAAGVGTVLLRRQGRDRRPDFGRLR